MKLTRSPKLLVQTVPDNHKDIDAATQKLNFHGFSVVRIAPSRAAYVNILAIKEIANQSL